VIQILANSVLAHYWPQDLHRKELILASWWYTKDDDAQSPFATSNETHCIRRGFILATVRLITGRDGLVARFFGAPPMRAGAALAHPKRVCHHPFATYIDRKLVR
jgi:hypothetical protein